MGGTAVWGKKGDINVLGNDPPKNQKREKDNTCNLQDVFI